MVAAGRVGHSIVDEKHAVPYFVYDIPAPTGCRVINDTLDKGICKGCKPMELRPSIA